MTNVVVLSDTHMWPSSRRRHLDSAYRHLDSAGLISYAGDAPW